MNFPNSSHSYFRLQIILLVFAGLIVVMPYPGMTAISGESSRNSVIKEEEISRIIEGEVTRVQGEFVGKDFSQMKDRRYLLKTPHGGEWDLRIEDDTQIIGDIFLGDYVQARVDKDGTPYSVQKISQKQGDSQKPVLREITGTVEKKKGNFLYVKQGDHTETLHLDHQSTLEGDIKEGSNIAAQLGEAGYAIKIQEFHNTTQPASPEVSR
jgi:hypothetical protein